MWEEDRATAASVGHPVVLDSRTRSGLVGRGAVGRGLAGRDAVSGGGAREWRGGDTGGGLAGKSGLPSGASQARRLGWDSPWCGSVMFSQRQVILSVERRRVCRAVVTASSRPVLLAASAKATGSPLLGGFSCWAVAPTSRLPFPHPASALSACASFLCNGSPLRVLFGQLGQPASCSFSQTRLQCAQASPFCQFCRGCLTGALKYGRDGGLLPGAGACQPDWPGPGWEPASHTGPSVSRMSPLLSQMRGWGQSVWASLYGLLGTLQL